MSMKNPLTLVGIEPATCMSGKNVFYKLTLFHNPTTGLYNPGVLCISHKRVVV